MVVAPVIVAFPKLAHLTFRPVCLIAERAKEELGCWGEWVFTVTLIVSDFNWLADLPVFIFHRVSHLVLVEWVCMWFYLSVCVCVWVCVCVCVCVGGCVLWSPVVKLLNKVAVRLTFLLTSCLFYTLWVFGIFSEWSKNHVKCGEVKSLLVSCCSKLYEPWDWSNIWSYNYLSILG